MKKEDVLIRYLVLGILICVAAGVLCLAAADMSLFGSTGRRGILYNEDLITFNRDWTVSAYGYGEYQPEDLPYRGKFPSGTFVTLVNTLPYSVKEGTYVAFRNMYCVCDVYIGDELIYSSPAYVSAYRTFPVPGWVFVPLTEEYSARTISIVMKSPYRFVPVTVPVMLLGTHAEVLLYSRDSGYFDLYVAVTVAVLGLIVMLFAAFNMTASGSRRACVFTGLCMTALGAALMIGTGIARMSESADFMEYMIGRLIFLLCPVLYSSSMCAESPEGKRKKISTVLAAVSFCCFILCVMSHYLGLADLTATSFAARILMLLILGTDLYFTLKGASAAGIYYRIATAAGTAALAAETVMGCMPGFEVYALSLIHI